MDKSKKTKAVNLLNEYREFIASHIEMLDADLDELEKDDEMLGEIMARQADFNKKLQSRAMKLKNEVLTLYGFA